MHRRTFLGRLFGSAAAAACGAAPPAPAKPAGPRLDGIYAPVAPPLSPDEKARLLADWEAMHRGVGRVHKIIVLPDGMTYTPVGTGTAPPEARP